MRTIVMYLTLEKLTTFEDRCFQKGSQFFIRLSCIYGDIASGTAGFLGKVSSGPKDYVRKLSFQITIVANSKGKKKKVHEHVITDNNMFFYIKELTKNYVCETC